MSPRTRTISDADILAGAADHLGRVGPTRLTLAGVARDVGLSPATLLQRFRSKRGLLLALAEQGSATAGQEFDRAHMTQGPALDTLIAALVDMTRHAATPESFSHHLAFLHIDLTDPEFHSKALVHSRVVLAEIHRLLQEAVDAGEMIPCDTGRLAHAVHATYNGALVTWAINRQGTASAWVRRDLETVLDAVRKRPV
ncbi:MAG: hypothetical protein NVSMB22_03410 [Chloroflexota bacterium]